MPSKTGAGAKLSKVSCLVRLLDLQNRLVMSPIYYFHQIYLLGAIYHATVCVGRRKLAVDLNEALTPDSRVHEGS
jgi:hypothetical protein